MNVKETRETLIDTRKMIKTMDLNHVERLFNALINAQDKKPCAFFLHMDIRKCVKKMLSDLIKSKQVNTQLTCKQMKRIYTIIGDYGLSPVCRLCGQPIAINSETAPDRPGAFSWDHVIPRAYGGPYELFNTEPAHRVCNSRRGCDPFVPKNQLNICKNMNCNCEDCNNPKQYRHLCPRLNIHIKEQVKEQKFTR